MLNCLSLFTNVNRSERGIPLESNNVICETPVGKFDVGNTILFIPFFAFTAVE